MNPYFKDYSEYLSEIFPGLKVQKLSLNAGHSCPNRDGTIGTGGCIYCSNSSFTPAYCLHGNSIAEQLKAGKAFFSRKYPAMKYLAYFQSFTATHTSAGKFLSDALAVSQDPEVVGIIVGTRPDCLPAEIMRALGELAQVTTVMVELGAESSHDQTLALVNRGHKWSHTVEAVECLASLGIRCGLHFIEGLPGETRQMMLQTVDRAAALPVDSLKFHHLQLIKGTEMHRRYKKNALKLDFFTAEEYLCHCVQIVERVPRRIAIERFLASSPPDMVEAPRWGLKNYEFTHRLLAMLSSGQG